MIIAEALAALWSLGQAAVAWLLVGAAVGTALLFSTAAGAWWVCRALRRAVRPRHRETA
ncbi:hypothetical protein [Streptomyces sp. 049-1]|uniref:hypothetical protein n=1 Tax=Streptomyces sp. 049-1 TaxID=2789264 RepID=UPI00397FDCD5